MQEEHRFVIEPLTYVLLTLIGVFFASFRQTYFIGIVCGFLGLFCVAYTKQINYVPKRRLYNLSVYGCIYAIIQGIFCGWLVLMNYSVIR